MKTGNTFDNLQVAILITPFALNAAYKQTGESLIFELSFFFCSLNSLVHSSRKLTLRLLDFISKHQVIIFQFSSHFLP